jgi:hypothetical protein
MKRIDPGSPPAKGGVHPSTVTIAIPPIEVPAHVHVHEAPPALVTKRNAGHVGMTGAELLRVLRAMSTDPRFGAEVIRHGKSFRAAPPSAIVAYLRAAPSPAVKEGEPEMDLELLESMGYERTRAR